MGERNWPFVAWMLLWPLGNSGGDYLDYLANGSVVKHYSENVLATTAFFILLIWIVVGALLYEPHRSSNNGR